MGAGGRFATKWFAAWTVAAGLVLIQDFGVSSASAAGACADVIVYGIRGSGEGPQSGAAVAPFDPRNPSQGYSATWDAFDPIDPVSEGSSISANLELAPVDGGSAWAPDTKTPLVYDVVQKINQRVGVQLNLSWTPIRYPAVPVELGDVRWWIHNYDASVVSGVRELNRALRAQWDKCGTSTRYVLVGYSQGADVIHSYLSGTGANNIVEEMFPFLSPTPAIRKQIAAVTLLADPGHQPGRYISHEAKAGQWSSGLGGVKTITFNGRGVDTVAADVTNSYCLPNDIVCGINAAKIDEGKKIHTSAYLDGDDYAVNCATPSVPARKKMSVAECAANVVVDRLGVRNLVEDPIQASSALPGTTGLDVVFLIDTTGSMAGDIASARRFAGDAANRIRSLDGRVALVEYRDRGDTTPVRTVSGLEDGYGAFRSGLSRLRATGGGDEPEALLHALTFAFNDLSWRPGSAKAAIVLTDAGFHDPDLIGGETVRSVANLSLRIDPVNIFPVAPRGVDYSQLAAATTGEVIARGSDTEGALTRVLDRLKQRPIAVLAQPRYTAPVGRSVTLDASGSVANLGRIVSFEWDLDGDGYVDRTTRSPRVEAQFQPGSVTTVEMTVVDSAGLRTNTTALVTAPSVAQPVKKVPDGADSLDVTGAVMAATGEQSEDDELALEVAWSGDVGRSWTITIAGVPYTTVEAGVTSTSVRIPNPELPVEVGVYSTNDAGDGPELSVTLPALYPDQSWWRSGWVAGLLALFSLLCLSAAVLRTRRKVDAR